MYLVTGCDGQLGNELKRLLGENADYTDRKLLDITNPEVVKLIINPERYQAVINCAAYTAVDKAEDDADAAAKINIEGPANLAVSGVPLIHISTDYVFDGRSYTPYIETDPTRPKSVYGCTKLEGEKAVMTRADTAIIIRTSWLYSEFGNNFVKTMRRLGKERHMLKVIFDQIGTPTYAADLAAAIVQILPQIKQGTKSIYHFSNEGVCSWYDFAKAIIEMSGLDCAIYPIESWEYPSKTSRPPYSVLNKAKIKKEFGLRIRYWRDALRECIDRMEGNIL